MSDLWKLAQQYVTETEIFDAQVCTGRRNDIAVAQTWKERALSCSHAAKVNQTLLEVALSLGYTVREWNRARRQAIREFETKHK